MLKLNPEIVATATDSTLEHRSILGIRVWCGSITALVARTFEAADAYRQGRRAPYVFACANPHSLTVAEQEPEFKQALRTADAVVADGVGLTVVARAVYGMTSLPRITGSDYFQAVMSAMQSRGGRVAFFGSSPGVLQKLVARCRAQFPRVAIAAAVSPPYGNWSEEQNEHYLGTLREARADVLWVGMTAPKQEKWVQANLSRLDVPLVGSIGAVFDYFAGTVQRAPEWLCRAGFEWAYRFMHEPARLWERNFVSGPRFIGLALRDRTNMNRAASRDRANS